MGELKEFKTIASECRDIGKDVEAGQLPFVTAFNVLGVKCQHFIYTSVNCIFIKEM